MEEKNEYLQQVRTAQAVVESSLKTKKTKSSLQDSLSTSLNNTQHNYKITGIWRFKNVIVPPNMYVVHTRRGHSKPINLGLGVSFRYDPMRDSFLVIPSAMQTIVVNANSICKERQGIVVQSYVQWIIDDFNTAYQKLDFSDPIDPMSIVNIQLREQAEAVIKDTVSMMNIDNILSDKSPIIKDLTKRLGELADGLGLKIVTVQIKEAVVSSTRLWDNLQKPFRAERAKDARLAELSHQEEVNNKEIETEKQMALRRIQKESDIAAKKRLAEATAFDSAHTEKTRRAQMEDKMRQELLQFDLRKIQAEAEIKKLKTIKELEEGTLRFTAETKEKEKTLELLKIRQTIENDIGPIRLQERFIESLPEIVSNLPTPKEFRSFSLGSTQLDGVMGSLNKILDSIGD